MRRTALTSPLAPTAIVLATTLALGAAACGGPDDDTTPSASGSASSVAPTATPTATPTPAVAAFPADTGPVDGGYGSGNGLGLTGVRTAHRSGYDRVVLDLDGTGRPGFHVRYVKRPRADGSGDPVRLRGTTYLQVVLRGMGLPSDTGIASFGDAATRVPGSGTTRVTEIAPGGTFEGAQQAFVGLDGARTPLRAFVLSNPTRLVVDVRDE